MLISMRKGVGSWVAKIFIGILVLSFAVWGIADLLTNRSETALASIEGREIQLGEFQREFQRELYRLQQRFGPEFDTQQARAAGLDFEVLRQMLTRMMFDQRADELGLATPDAVVARAIRENASFLDPFGAFDRFAFDRALRENGYTEADFVARTRGELTRRQLIAGITSGATPSGHLTESLYKQRNETRVLEILQVPQSAVGALREPSEADIRAFYEENTSAFTAPEYRTVTYLTLQPADLAAEMSIDEADIRDEYSDRLSEFTIIGRRDLEQFVLADRARADEATARIEAGEDFRDIAQEYAGVSPQDMLLSDVTRQELLPEVADAVFELADGEISRPLESALGWQIVRVSRVQPGRTKSFAEVREQLSDEIALRRGSDALYEIVNTFEDARASGDQLEEAAAAIGATIRRIAEIDRSGADITGKPIADLPESPEFLADIFASAEGEENDLRETDAGGYFVVRVDAITPATVREFTSVRSDALAGWLALETGSALEKLADEIRTTANSGTSLAELAAARGLSVTPTEPIARTHQDAQLSAALVAKIFAAEPGTHVSGAVPAGGYAVVRIREVVTPSPTADKTAFENAKAELERALADELLVQYQSVLERRYELRVDQNQLTTLFDAQ